MRFFLKLFRSFWGVLTFNLPMNCVPQYVDGGSLVALLSAFMAALYALEGKRIDAIPFLILFMYFKYKQKKSEMQIHSSRQSARSVSVSLCYLLVVSEIISYFSALAIISINSSTENLAWVRPAVRMWQMAVLVVYTRVLIRHHKQLAKIKA